MAADFPATSVCAIVVVVLVNSMAAENTEGFIVGGNFTSIENFAHSAFMLMRYVDEDGVEEYYTCGCSILNQAVLLTAAHCFDGYEQPSSGLVFVGHENLDNASMIPIAEHLVHEKYDMMDVSNDIALVLLKKYITFGRKVRRVALMAEPPYHAPATVAGWGLVDEKYAISSKELKFARQHVMSRASCHALLSDTPVGTLCAGSANSTDYAAAGDSGSALIVHGYIQIGLVSYKDPSASKSVVVYTDVGHFYQWIQDHATLLHCQQRT